MHMAIPNPAGSSLRKVRLTLMDWINAQRALLEEEERLKAFAARKPAQTTRAEEVERQRMRVQVAQDAADAIYDAVMTDLRNS